MRALSGLTYVFVDVLRAVEATLVERRRNSGRSQSSNEGELGEHCEWRVVVFSEDAGVVLRGD